MASPNLSVMNNFTAGLKTEFTGLNFPENACYDTKNCVFTLIGDVTRRPGIDVEQGHKINRIDRGNTCMSNFVWTNAGGDGNTKLFVLQIAGELLFFNITSATVAEPLSAQQLGSTINLGLFYSGGSIFPSEQECEYAVGNGYLFVFNKGADPFYCTYSSGTVTATAITIKIRDLEGILEPGVDDSVRLTTLSFPHFYNLLNQGWAGNAASLPAGGTGGGDPEPTPPVESG